MYFSISIADQNIREIEVWTLFFKRFLNPNLTFLAVFPLLLLTATSITISLIIDQLIRRVGATAILL